MRGFTLALMIGVGGSTAACGDDVVRDPDLELATTGSTGVGGVASASSVGSSGMTTGETASGTSIDPEQSGTGDASWGSTSVTSSATDTFEGTSSGSGNEDGSTVSTSEAESTTGTDATGEDTTTGEESSTDAGDDEGMASTELGDDAGDDTGSTETGDDGEGTGSASDGDDADDGDDDDDGSEDETTDSGDVDRCVDHVTPGRLADPDPWLGEFEIEDPVYYGQDGSSAQRIVRLHAADPVIDIAVFQQARKNGDGWAADPTVVATRIDADGCALDPGGIQLAVARPHRQIGALVSDGHEALVTYREKRGEDQYVLIVDRIDAAGKLLFSDETKILFDEGTLAHSALAVFDGERYVLAWIHTSEGEGAELYVQEVEPESLAMGVRHVVAGDLTSPDLHMTRLSMVERDGRIMLGWSHGEAGRRGYRVTTLEPDLSPSDPGGRDVPSLALEDLLADVVVRPGGFALLVDRRDGERRRLSAELYDLEGESLGLAPIDIHDKSYDRYQPHFPRSAVTDSDRWWLTVSARPDRHALAIELDADAGMADVPLELADGKQFAGSIDCAQDECRVAMDAPDGLPSFWRYDHDMSVVEDTILPIERAAFQHAPAMAHEDGQIALCWSAFEREPGSSVRGAMVNRIRRLSRTGRWLDPVPRRPEPLAGDSGPCHVTAIPGGGFLVYWAQTIDEERVVRARRLARDGRWAWPEIVTLRDHLLLPGIQGAACSAEYCAIGLEATRRIGHWWISSAGEAFPEPNESVVADELVDIASYHRYLHRPSGDPSSPDRIWFAWNQLEHLQVRVFDASGPRVGRDDARVFNWKPVAHAEFRDRFEWRKVAGRWYIFYLLSVPIPDQMSVYNLSLRARSFDPTQGFGEVIELFPDRSAGREWDVTTVLEDGVERLHVYLWGQGSAQPEVLRARFSNEFELIEDAVAVWPEQWMEFPRLLDAGDRNLAAYTRLDWNVGFGEQRARIRFIDESPLLRATGEHCTDDGQCASGRCRDARCCDDCTLWRGR